MQHVNRKHMISGWGNYPRVSAEVIEPRSVQLLREAVRAAKIILPRGLGRSHGDAALARIILSLNRLNNFLEFDEEKGILVSEGGVSLAEILEIVIPRGWFLPVTPGTKHITLSGAIAADVHGKNHHKEGSFGDYVVSIDVVDAEGNVITSSREKSPELFHATIGGMGLTGIIVRAALRLKPIETSYISQTILRAKNFEEALRIFDEAKDATYSVAWFDGSARGGSLGRSVIFLGEHAQASALPSRTASLQYWSKKPLPVFFYPPGFLLGGITARTLNSVFYAINTPRKSIVPYEPFFYPLDRLADWNRFYGRRGSVEYQCLVPKKGGNRTVQLVLERVAASGHPSFLSTLKLFGKENDNLLSFPMEGYSVGLAFPVSYGLLPFLSSLDEIVMRAGGRLYLAKDARMPKKIFDAGYPCAEKFRKFKRSIDPENKFRSLQSMRLGLY